jgi:hypothetical protein
VQSLADEWKILVFLCRAPHLKDRICRASAPPSVESPGAILCSYTVFAVCSSQSNRLTGWVKTEGDKVNFVNDKDKQTWSVKNPDVLKSHDGKHVKVKATLDENDKSMTIDNNVKELRAGKQSGENQKKQ